MMSAALMLAGTLTAEAAGDKSEPLIGKSDIVIKGGRMTPEALGLWEESADLMFHQTERKSSIRLLTTVYHKTRATEKSL